MSFRSDNLANLAATGLLIYIVLYDVEIANNSINLVNGTLANLYSNYLAVGAPPIVNLPSLGTYTVSGIGTPILTIANNSFSCAFPVPFSHFTTSNPDISTWNNSVTTTSASYQGLPITVITFCYCNDDFLQSSLTFGFPSHESQIFSSSYLYSVSPINANYYQMLQ